MQNKQKVEFFNNKIIETVCHDSGKCLLDMYLKQNFVKFKFKKNEFRCRKP